MEKSNQNQSQISDRSQKQNTIQNHHWNHIRASASSSLQTQTLGKIEGKKARMCCRGTHNDGAETWEHMHDCSSLNFRTFVFVTPTESVAVLCLKNLFCPHQNHFLCLYLQCLSISMQFSSLNAACYQTSHLHQMI